MNATNAAPTNIAATAERRRDWTPQPPLTTRWIDKGGAVVRLMGSGSSRSRSAGAISATIAGAQHGVKHADSRQHDSPVHESPGNS